MKKWSICNGQRCKFVSSILILCLLMATIDSILCGIFLWSDEYVKISNLWRTRGGILKHLPLGIVVYLILATTIVVLFRDFVVKANKKVVLIDFLKAGLLIGLLIGTIFLGFYVILPIALNLVSVWFASSIIFGILAGYILYFFNK